MANVPQDKRILSIQSHVVAGYVGNKAASFPLQLLGWEVDAALTVSFSNHTVRYGRWGGSKFDAAHLEDVFSALDANGLLRQSHLLTGYVPGADALKVVVRAVDRLRAVNPKLVYVLDPVMGDDGRIYVSESVIPIYKALLPRATCATPNYFEAELLTDVKILDAASLKAALRAFHERYRLPNIVISAVSLGLAELEKLGFTGLIDASSPATRMLVCSGSTIVSAPGEAIKSVAFGVAFPELAEHYEGVGDVFSSLVAGRFPCHSDPAFSAHPVSPLAHTVELAIGSLQGILARTRQHALALTNNRPEAIVPREGESADDRVRRLRTVELRLVQSQREILNPDVRYRAVRFEP
ncbi:hypothetical protein JCM10908_006368 [Rhodotorula pacifica]|uniref:uncharacterized protein n=1 Tax=Rhodotorula pacifica TaxID=1495444 RepID=UPI00317F7A95